MLLQTRGIVGGLVDGHQTDGTRWVLFQTCKLLPHQVLGVRWLKKHEVEKQRGGILADDMGLGKVGRTRLLLI